MIGRPVSRATTARRPRNIARAAGLLSIWLLLLVFIVYPLTMLLLRAFFADGAFTLDALFAAITSTSNLRALRNSLLLALLVGAAGTLIGLVFALTLERANLGPRAARADRHPDVPAADFSALHDLDCVRVLVRSARPHHLRSARHQGRADVRPHQHVRGRNAHLFPDRLSGAAADAGVDQQQLRGSLLQSRRLALACVPHGDDSAHHPGAGERVPAAVWMLARRFRDAADPRRKRFSRCCRPRRICRSPACSISRAARSCRCCCWCRRARVLRAGARRRGALLCDRHRQGLGVGAARHAVGGRTDRAADILRPDGRAHSLFLCAAVLGLDRRRPSAPTTR